MPTSCRSSRPRTWRPRATTCSPGASSGPCPGDAEFDRVLSALDPANASGAANASALVVGGFTRAGRKGRPNPWAEHDLGMATAQLVLQAVASGLAAHPMAGFDAGRLRTALAIPADIEPMTVTAIGWPAEEVAAAPRAGVPLERVAFRGSWPSGEERLMGLGPLAGLPRALHLAVLTPGPTLLAVVGHAAGSGFRRTVPVVLGNALGIAAVIAVSIAGLGGALFRAPTLRSRRARRGLYLAVHGDLVEPGERRSRRQGRRTGAGPFGRGLLLVWSNPKALIFFGAVLPQFLRPGGSVPLQLGQLAATFITLELAVTTSAAVVAGRLVRAEGGAAKLGDAARAGRNSPRGRSGAPRARGDAVARGPLTHSLTRSASPPARSRPDRSSAPGTGGSAGCSRTAWHAGLPGCGRPR